MASVTVTLPSTYYSVIGQFGSWTFPVNERIDLGTTLSSDANPRLLALLLIRVDPTASRGDFHIGLVGTQTDASTVRRDFSDDMEAEGFFVLQASDGVSITITGGTGGDTTEQYAWTPGNAADVFVFWEHIHSLTDRTLTVTFDDNQNAAPVVSGVSANPDIVNANGTVALSGTATDPDAVPDTLALQWTANPNIGVFSAPTALSTNWTAQAPQTTTAR